MKQISVLTIALFLSTLAFGQWELKPTIGFNVTNVSKDPATGKAKGQLGWQFGASALIGNKFYVEPGLLFVKKSTKYTEQGQSSADLTTDLNGLRIPVAVGYHLLGGEETTLALRVFGGASAFIVTNVKAEGFEKDDFESPTWGLFAGAGLDIWILFFDLQYEWSLTDVSSVTQFDVGKTRSFFFNTGVRLQF